MCEEIMNLRLSTTHSPFGEPLNRFDRVQPKVDWRGTSPYPMEPGLSRTDWLPAVTRSTAKKFRSVLVPLDGTPLGESALPLAVSVARAAGAELQLVHVHSPMDIGYFGHAPTLYDNGVKRYYTRYVERLARRIGDAARTAVIPSYLEHRDTVEGLCEAANSEVDLVITATRAHGLLGRLWHGSTVHGLLRRLSIPLLVVRGDGLLPAVSPDRWLRRMLIPLDGTQSAESVLDAAVALGSLYRSDYSLLRVISPADMAGTMWRGSQQRDGAPRAASVREEVSRYLNGVQNRMNSQSKRVEAKTTTGYGPIATSIVAKAATADCIAMATRDRGALGRLVSPSIAWQVIKQASVPVLIVRADEDS
jgi:nucleotide-binding universal stress UspA family protein